MSTALPSLETVIESFELRPKKSLGQNFLLDPALLSQLVRYAGSLKGMHVLEIGPGPGGLTRALLESDAAHVTALERDERAVRAASLLVQTYPERFSIREGDALDVNPIETIAAPRAIVANLPYNISTVLLTRWLEHIQDDANAYALLLLMFQKEVANRLTAGPNDSSYGRLSVLTQWLCDTEQVYDIPAEAFSPPPKVDSALVRFVPKPIEKRADAGSYAALSQILDAAFGQRRKMLRRSMKGFGDAFLDVMEQCGIESDRRAESLSVMEYAALAKAWHLSNGTGSNDR